MTTPIFEKIRPSALPKLQECRCYVGTTSTSEAASRGTELDRIIRERWSNSSVNIDDLPDEDKEAIVFAGRTLDLLACGSEVETDEKELRAAVPVQGVSVGVMDALCVESGWLADFKTGQIRDYSAQMAAYALACMDSYFADEWTTHLIYVDQKQVVSRNWTRDDAERLVTGIVNAPKVETPCDYCSWCGAFESCPAISRSAQLVTQEELPANVDTEVLPPTIQVMLDDHKLAHLFLTRLKAVNAWADVLKAKLLQNLDGNESDYFKRVVVSGSKKVNPLSLAKFGMELGYDRMLKICSQVPLKKVQEVWKEVFGDKPVPEDIIVTSGGSVQLKLKTTKQIENK